MSNKRPSYHPPLFGTENREITYSWKPSTAAVARIAELGLDPYTIKNELRTEFIIYCESQGLREKNYNNVFIEYAQEHYGLPPASKPQAPTPHNSNTNAVAPFSPSEPSLVSSAIMTDEWQPSHNMLEYILAMVCPNKEYIQAQLISFTSHYYGKTHANWDQQFKKWINQGWNVYQNKNNFKQDNNKGFIETHTDKSWSDGL